MTIAAVPAEVTLRVSTVTSSSGHSVVRVEGPLTFIGSTHLSDVLEILIAAKRLIITVDLSHAEWDHRAGLRVLSRAYRAQRAAGGRMMITGTHGRLQRILTAAGLPAA
ncbi:MAG TPA: STAS domain-containing protein [Mycobacteriales bacterium]|nr:STAS domain-containing protein [Mycobacteriales bacterium]